MGLEMLKQNSSCKSSSYCDCECCDSDWESDYLAISSDDCELSEEDDLYSLIWRSWFCVFFLVELRVRCGSWLGYVSCLVICVFKDCWLMRVSGWLIDLN